MSLRKWLCLPLLGVACWQAGAALWLESKAVLAQVLIHDAWQARLASHAPVKPWTWADTWPVARLVHPATDTELMVLSGADGSSLAFGPGWLQGSAPPGDAGTTVIAGHRDTHFQFLRTVQLGDVLELTDSEGNQRRYRVHRQTLADSHKDALWVDPNTDQLLLITCYPLDALQAGGSQRLIVTALPETDTGVLQL